MRGPWAGSTYAIWYGSSASYRTYPVEPPRLYIVTRGAQPVLAGDPGQPGARRGARFVAGVRQRIPPRADHLDRSRRGHESKVGTATAGAVRRRRDRLAGRPWYAARMSAAPLGPEERRTAVGIRHMTGWVSIHRPGDLERIELVRSTGSRRERGRSRSLVTASSLNFADVLIAMGRYPSIDGAAP